MVISLSWTTSSRRGASRPCALEHEEDLVSVNKLLVAGAGQMGAGIVQVSAVAGLEVVMIDVAEEFVARGMAGIEKGLGRLVDKGRMEASARDAALARITTSTDMAAGADADLFIEAAPESMELKQGLFEQVAALLRPDAIIASNTSSLSVSALAAFVTEPAALRRHPLLQPRADDGAGRGRARRADRATRRSPPPGTSRRRSARRRSPSRTLPGSSSTASSSR